VLDVEMLFEPRDHFREYGAGDEDPGFVHGAIKAWLVCSER
jgi:hypothetical protein